MPTILRAKCIVVGESGVGKSSICQVFHSDGSSFPKTYSMNAGVELLVKSVNIPDSHDSVEIFMFDSAGKEIFSEAVKKFWQNPSMVMVVYDVTSETSFSSCEKWLQRVRSQFPDVELPGVLIANKVDLDQRRVVSPKAGKDLATSHQLEYFECSSKEIQNVDTPFFYLAAEYHKLYEERVQLFQSIA
ncbi:intraflagellar transport protein 27 homolog [Haliotis cracherodii]|uniref:intraflagellar transport protein 27 homolog n=1 Tax=Haliotis cracherodii TaxID=6455 RepID=UPI0039EB48C7